MDPLAISTSSTEERSTPTIKGLHWKLLFGNHRAELGDDGWARLAEATGAPADVKSLPLAEDVPLAPFNQALVFLDEHLGEGDGGALRSIAVASVHRWATMYRTLVSELEGRPATMLEIFCEEIHPWFVDDDAAAELVHLGQGQATLRMTGPLDDRFKAGLVEGFIELTGATAEVDHRGEGLMDVAWDGPELSQGSLAKAFVGATRPAFLANTIVPVLLGTALAGLHAAIDPILAVAATAAAVCLHLAAYAFNDIIDHLRGVDPANLTPTPFSGGSRTLQLGILGVKEVALLAIGLGTVGIGLGLWLASQAPGPILPLGLAGVALGYAYSAQPFRLADRGLGELTAGLVFGPLIVAGAYAVHTGSLSVASSAAGIPVGLLMSAQLYVNEMPDAPWDARTGRRTLVVRLGEHAWLGLAGLLALAYLTLVGAAVTGALPMGALAGLATVPVAAWITWRVTLDQRTPEELVPYQAGMLALHAVTGALMVGAVFWEAWL